MGLVMGFLLGIARRAGGAAAVCNSLEDAGAGVGARGSTPKDHGRDGALAHLRWSNI